MEIDKRLIDLEIKFTHQEDLLDQLNKVVTQQKFAMDKLIKEVNELKLTSIHGQAEIGNEKPPHY